MNQTEAAQAKNKRPTVFHDYLSEILAMCLLPVAKLSVLPPA